MLPNLFSLEKEEKKQWDDKEEVAWLGQALTECFTVTKATLLPILLKEDTFISSLLPLFV